MNNTKWNEIFEAFYYENECKQTGILIRWRNYCCDNGYLSPWDGTWTHFGCEPRNWDNLEYLQIELTDDNKDYVLATLKRVHVPGEIKDGIVTIYGYRTDVDYI